MNLKQMEYFVAAAEQLNFTRAAKKCFISQTAMTLQIQSLEEKIGVPLFVRDKHHVELTAAGKVYLNEARAVLVRAEEAAKLARTAAEGVAGELTIGFIRGYEQSRFSETLRSFHEAYPNISIHLLRENMSALYEQKGAAKQRKASQRRVCEWRGGAAPRPLTNSPDDNGHCPPDPAPSGHRTVVCPPAAGRKCCPG